jgi:hypothetical protein
LSCLEFAVLIASAFLPPLSIKQGERSRDPDECRVSMDYSEVPLGTILKDLERTTGIPITIKADPDPEQDPRRVRISIKVQNLPVTAALRLILQPRFSSVAIIAVEHRKILVQSNH